MTRPGIRGAAAGQGDCCGAAAPDGSSGVRPAPRGGVGSLQAPAMFAAGVVLGLQFRDARVGQGLTQAEFSGLAGIPQADISRIERGAGNPTESTLKRLAHALNGRLQLVTA